MVCDRCNCYSSLWANFYPFTCPIPTPPPQPLTAQKIKIFKSKKALGDIIILHMSVKNYDQMMYGS